ncbi:MAG: hypothetical protein JXR78_00500 [Victivallales bacterium]|nr:hypothetical protein [Victivallales bacterium]
MSSMKKFDWIIMNWLCQLLFFAVICITLVINLAGDGIRSSGWIFMTLYTLLFAFSCINSLCLHMQRTREVIGISMVLLLIFVVPLTYYSLGGSIEATSGMSLVYVLMSITMSPLLVGVGILFCALCYSGFIHYSNFFEQYPVFREALSEFSEVSDVSRNPMFLNTRDYIVKEPMTIQQISAEEEVYGNEDYWLTLLSANRELPKSPGDIIPAGTRLLVPVSKGRPYKVKEYTVPRESTLREISANADIYGNESYWKYLYDANRSKVIDTQLTILGGTKLIVPVLPEGNHYKFLIISLIYVAAALVGMCWKILLKELYRLLSVAFSASTGQTARELEEAKLKLETLTTDNRRLRKEVALHIVEMDQIITYKEPKNDEKKS